MIGWITLAQAQTGASTTASTNAAAKLIATWLDGQNACVTVSHTHPTETLYSREGISLKQELDVLVVEYRGLAKDLADFLAQYLNEDNTRQWLMYGIDQFNNIHEAEITYGPPSNSYATALYYWVGGAGSSKYVTDLNTKLGHYFYPPTDGKTVEAEAQRSNAADGWFVRVTTTLYLVPSPYPYTYSSRDINKAFIPVPPAEAWNGVTVSQNKQKTFLAYNNNTPVYQNVTTTVKEYRYLTLAQASSKVASESAGASNSRTFDVRVAVSWGTGGTSYKNITVRGGGNDGSTAATDKVVTSRPQGHGLYTVTVNEITYQGSTS